MKILCDVCGKEEASVFCCADEAALCVACDRRVHRANKVAGKHHRFSLFAPSAQSHPTCDICQEKRGFLFCQEDRAILCRDCDASVHSANHLTMKHNRFVLTGVRLSAETISSSPSPEPDEEAASAEAAAKAKTETTLSVSNQNAGLTANSSSPIASTGGSKAAAASPTTTITSTSSISEYLIKMCPGWRVEDLLVDDAAAAMEDFSKGDELLPFLDPDLDGGGLEAVAEKFPVWVPHVPQFPALHSSGAALPASAGLSQPWNISKEAGLTYHHGMKGLRERWSEDMFTVPQVSPASTPSKRPRHSLWYY
ncbi:hypothetical protein Cni_G21912 [Canna indica]|uniref:B box-type domain-containing protein n=1 Tax=Canna indica TaxID=4628 RepID=A0AAQ3KQF9_9LILI|nr:hypothetical protein Cni_G21912 [Canna indica]